MPVERLELVTSVEKRIQVYISRWFDPICSPKPDFTRPVSTKS
jgi:hypothetical protein